MARTGRRPGKPDTREAILSAARARFADLGYDGASIRAIAARAGVDPALVHHYFGTKEELFRAALQLPIDPSAVVPEVADGGIDGFGERLVRTILRLWDAQAGGAAAVMLRSAVANEGFARMLREWVAAITQQVGQRLGWDQAEAAVRVNLIVSQAAGLITTRYLVQIEPMASLDPELIVAMIGPTMQRYAADPLPPAASAPPLGHGP